MEHIYEGVWIVHFLTYLSSVEKIPCDVLERLFFTEWHRPGESTPQPAWIKELMASLGSTQNQNDLVFLWADINGAKYRIFDIDNDIIREKGTNGFASINAHSKIKRIATVGRVMAYMQHHEIGEKLLSTAQNIERTLADIIANLQNFIQEPQLSMMGRLKDSGVLVARHRKWLNGFLGERNDLAITSMSR